MFQRSLKAFQGVSINFGVFNVEDLLIILKDFSGTSSRCRELKVVPGRFRGCSSEIFQRVSRRFKTFHCNFEYLRDEGRGVVSIGF